MIFPLLFFGTPQSWAATQQITAGEGHNVILKSDGTLWAWGDNYWGQLGDGTVIDKHSPIQIGSDNNWISVAGGRVHSLALRSDGTLWAWGYNVYGQLGDGTTINKLSPIQIGSDNNWVSVAAGGYHSLALKSDGTLWAWGYNNRGQLGDGTTINKVSPIQIGPDNNWVSVAGGWGWGPWGHSLALKSDGTLWAWGCNVYGQLGDGTTIDKHSPIQIGSDNNWASVAAGEEHSLALKSDGTLWAWGRNDYGQLGDGTTINKHSPIQIGSDDNWVSVAIGGAHSLALKSDGTLWAWGYNVYGQLGDGTTINKLSPIQIGSDSNWVSVAAGGYHSLALKSDGTLWAWGMNVSGQLGDGTFIDKHSPIQIGSDYNRVSITAGWRHSFLLNSDGTLWAWGMNVSGQLGDGTFIDKHSPIQIGSDNYRVSVAAGWHSLALKSDGTLWAWGYNAQGQLGDGTTFDKISPIQIGPDNNWVMVSGGMTHNLGLKSDGTLWAWGYNNRGQLGDGTTIDKHSPVQIGSDSNWVSVDTGSGPWGHSLALKSDGTLWAWGYNNRGQLGDGTAVDKHSPIQIGSDENWASVAAGEEHSLALKSDGTLWAWGHNDFGQLGDWTTIDKHSPIQIGSDNDWISVSGGWWHNLALKSDGTLWAWGYNYYGQLGDGTTINKFSPVQIGSENNWISVAAGGVHSLALKSDGTLWAWGRNDYGQLGDGTTTDRLNPIQVPFGSCTYSISPPNAHHPAGVGGGSVNVTAPVGCNWMSVSNDVWIILSSGVTGSGNGTVNYLVAMNSGPARTGTMTIAGLTFTLNQGAFDSDGDSLPDDWEMANFNNLIQGASGDPDGDSLTNLQEYQLGTNPNNPDTDGDGYSDGVEVAAGTDPNNAASKPTYRVDDFSADMIERTMWAEHEFVRFRSLEDRIGGPPYPGVLESELTRYGSNGDNSLTFVNPSSVNSIKADVTVNSIISNGAFPRAILSGFFFNDGIYDIRAEIGIGDIGHGLRGEYAVNRCSNSECAPYITVRFQEPLAVNLGETHTLSIAWDAAQKKFTFTFDGTPYTYSFDASATIKSTNFPFKAISTRVSEISGPNEGGYISATFDNVYVNGSLYDNFDSDADITEKIDPTKWRTWEFVRAVYDGQMASALSQRGVNGNNNTSFVDSQHISGFEADLEVIEFQNNGARPQARLYASLYNDGSSTGAGDLTGDVIGMVGILEQGGGPQAFYAVSRCTAPTCDEYAVLTSEILKPVGLNETHRFSISWNGLNVILGCDGDAISYNPTSSAPVNGLPKGRKGIGTRVSEISNSTEWGYVFAMFDNVVVTEMDSDLDGLPDSWEIANGTNPNSPDYKLTAIKSGTGDGTIDRSPLGIGYAPNQYVYSAGTPVTLTATPDASSNFIGWSGCDSANGNQCTVTMAANKAVNAIFDSTCTYSITPTSASVPASGATGYSVSATTGSGCSWTAVSNDGWITITGGASGSGNGTVAYTVAANLGLARTGTMTIAGQTFTVSQSAETTPSTGSILINNGVEVTNTTSVVLDLLAFDSTGIPEMCISNTPLCTNWEPFRPLKVWTLEPGDGPKTVNVWFKDSLGNANPAPYTDTIMLDTGAQTNWISTAAGESYTVALKSDGTLWAWGWNSYGQLGDGTTTDRWLPVQESTHANNWVAIAVGYYHTVALKSDGTLWAWGNNIAGQLGDETTTGRWSPVQESTHANNWVAIAAGAAHTVALKSDGTLWAWGYNGYGQLGDGTTTNRSSPFQESTHANNWVAMAAGKFHTVALKSDGTSWAWGYNGYGQLGDNSTTDRSSPVQESTHANTWVAIAAGYYHTVALKSDGTSWAWGWNRYGQLGDGTTTDRWSPVQESTHANNWVAIAAGQYHTVGLKSDGTLWAWGWNRYGQLGDGTTTDRWSPVQESTHANNWVAIAAGYSHTVALKWDGTFWAWGGNGDGQLGDGTTISRYSPVQAACFYSISSTGASYSAEGGESSIGVTATSAICAWTAVSNDGWITITGGASGSGNGTVTYTVAANSGLARTGTMIIAGQTFTVNQSAEATPPTGSILINNGVEVTNTTSVILDLSAFDPHGISEICISNADSCISWEPFRPLKVWTLEPGDGPKTVYAWFKDSLGNANTAPCTDTITLDTGAQTNWISMAAGQSYTVALKSDGTLWAWGWNFYGQLGDGTTTNRSSPVQESTHANNWVAIAVGESHTVALKSDGTLWAWGNNIAGQLGDGTTTNRSSPVQESTHANTWVAMAAGGAHTVALKSDGTLWAWGWNAYGQLGDGTTTGRWSPVQESTHANNWVAIAAGQYHTVALKSDGTLWAWGSNSTGQLGDGTTTNRSSPVQESTHANNWVAIAAGQYHTVALKSDGTLWAWGSNSTGQLGDGTTTDRWSPVQESTHANNWVAMAAGAAHTVALKSDGTLWAWGENHYGQLGDGTTTNRSSPVQESTHANNWVAIATGDYHTVALKSDGTLWAWGENHAGQLGDGTTVSRYSPVQIPCTYSIYTSAGSNVTVSLPGAGTAITFSNVSSPGYTTATLSNTGPALPLGFQLGNLPTYYDISTTASYAPPITVCITYDPAQYGDPSSLRLLHYESETWVDVTISIDLISHVLCGQVSSLSPFVVAQRIDNPPVITGASASPSVLWPANNKMVDVTVHYNATDDWDQPVCQISSVASNEPISSSDYAIVDDHHVKLCAKRIGSGNGRVYTIKITCTDNSGHSSSQAVTVSVPHDQRKK